MKKTYLILSILYFLNFNISYSSEQKKLDIDWNKLTTKEGRLELQKKYVEEKKWNWKKIYERKEKSFMTQSGKPIYGGEAYVDESTVIKTISIVGTYRSFYNLINLNETIGTSKSLIFSTRVDCKTKKYINDYMQFFSDHFGKGSSAMHKKWEGGYPNADWKNETRIEKLAKHVCKIKPSHVSDLTKTFKK